MGESKGFLTHFCRYEILVRSYNFPTIGMFHLQNFLSKICVASYPSNWYHSSLTRLEIIWEELAVVSSVGCGGQLWPVAQAVKLHSPCTYCHSVLMVLAIFSNQL